MKLTLNEAREQANVNFRSQRLFADGYTISTPFGYPMFREVTSPAGEVYSIEIYFETCSCPYFKKFNGEKDCKHLLGYEKLEADQAEAAEMADAEACEMSLEAYREWKQYAEMH